MPETYTIGRLSEAADVPISTVRYYEQRGLLRPEQRTASNYRVFGPVSLRRLRFIRIAQQSGFTLEDIGLLLRLRDGAAGDCCGEVKNLIEKRLEHITEQVRDLRRVHKVLQSTLEWCRNPRVKGRCQVLDDLDGRAGK
ncbi:MAG: MerR family transcriptional regulator [Planctomycetota bacterium]